MQYVGFLLEENGPVLWERSARRVSGGGSLSFKDLKRETLSLDNRLNELCSSLLGGPSDSTGSGRPVQ